MTDWTPTFQRRHRRVAGPRRPVARETPHGAPAFRPCYGRENITVSHPQTGVTPSPRRETRGLSDPEVLPGLTRGAAGRFGACTREHPVGDRNIPHATGCAPCGVTSRHPGRGDLRGRAGFAADWSTGISYRNTAVARVPAKRQSVPTKRQSPTAERQSRPAR